jgi:cell division septal protein FtsQ
MIIDSNDERPRQRTSTPEPRPETAPKDERPKRERAKKTAEEPERPTWKYAAWALCGLLILVVFLWVGSKVDEFLTKDPRFAVAVPEEAGEPSPNLQLNGLKRADREEILKVFAPDLGKSIYLVPLAERRERLTKIDWIRDAAVLRIWPNRIQVHLTERVPVAALHLPPTPRDTELSHDYHLALIDVEGAILTPYGDARPPNPVVTGISAETPIEDRKLSVQRVVKLMRERVIKVDASDPNNLKLYQPFMDREIVLLLGHEKFFVRLENYFTNIDKLPQHPDIPGFDLRPENQIVALSPVPKAAPAKAEGRPE